MTDLQKDGLINLIRYLSHICSEQSKARREALAITDKDKSYEYIALHFPVVQGTFQDVINKIGKQDVNYNAISEAIDYLIGEIHETKN